MSLCCRNVKFQALIKDVLSFSQHAPKQWHYCKLVKMESTVPLPSTVSASIPQCTGEKKKISIFLVESLSVLQKYLLQRRYKQSSDDAVKSEQLRQHFRRRCLSLEFKIHIKLEHYQNQLSVKAMRATDT